MTGTLAPMTINGQPLTVACFAPTVTAMETETAPVREHRTAAATRARRDEAKRRKVRAAAALLRGYGYTIEAPTLDLALIIGEQHR